MGSMAQQRERDRLEMAFKRVNNLKDMRIEQWFTGEAMGP